MKLPISPALLQMIIAEGFRYCYSKTTCIDTDEADVCITLTPVKSTPRLRCLPKAYDTFFNIRHEPVQMAEGVDRTVIYVNLNNSDLRRQLSA